jgi:hypothetical protein
MAVAGGSIGGVAGALPAGLSGMRRAPGGYEGRDGGANSISTSDGDASPAGVASTQGCGLVAAIAMADAGGRRGRYLARVVMDGRRPAR